MTLPGNRLLVITDETQCFDDTVLRRLVEARSGGPFSVVVRDKHMSPRWRRGLTEELKRADFEVIVADPPDSEARVHLSAQAELPNHAVTCLGRSWHQGDGIPSSRTLDYVTYSPIWASASKPGYGPTVGIDGLGAFCGAAPIPVYALGGVETPERIHAARAAGAYGVAVMGAVMRSVEPAEVVRRFNDAL
ncbi:thiamine phosphate synthase [Haloglycomyces albus]|uniref:thiamine phosphate synthase n=1 Tax=Haloglycomyces albus TaxID=526067 RepID=UPI00046C932A|nr:thiamine phosphate synthase [Haloglycomyces albus]